MRINAVNASMLSCDLIQPCLCLPLVHIFYLLQVLTQCLFLFFLLSYMLEDHEVLRWGALHKHITKTDNNKFTWNVISFLLISYNAEALFLHKARCAVHGGLVCFLFMYHIWYLKKVHDVLYLRYVRHYVHAKLSKIKKNFYLCIGFMISIELQNHYFCFQCSSVELNPSSSTLTFLEIYFVNKRQK